MDFPEMGGWGSWHATPSKTYYYIPPRHDYKSVSLKILYQIWYSTPITCHALGRKIKNKKKKHIDCDYLYIHSKGDGDDDSCTLSPSQYDRDLVPNPLVISPINSLIPQEKEKKRTPKGLLYHYATTFITSKQEMSKTSVDLEQSWSSRRGNGI